MMNRLYRRRLDAWEHRLVTKTTNRVVRPFEWGIEWTANWPCAAQNPHDGQDPGTYLTGLNQAAVSNSDDSLPRAAWISASM